MKCFKRIFKLKEEAKHNYTKLLWNTTFYPTVETLKINKFVYGMTSYPREAFTEVDEGMHIFRLEENYALVSSIFCEGELW